MSRYRCIVCGIEVFRPHGQKYCVKCGTNMNYLKLCRMREEERAKGYERIAEFHRKWVKI
jgi:uncharacterized Zn finger protein (UPF0148 family)